MDPFIPDELICYTIRHCDLLTTARLSISSRLFITEAWHFVRHVKLASLDRDLDLAGSQIKRNILDKLISAKSKVRSFSGSDLDNDCPYTDFILDQSQNLYSLNAEITFDNDILRLNFPGKLRRLSLKFSLLAEFDATIVAHILQLPELQYLSFESSVTEDAPKLLAALRDSALPKLQVLEMSLERPRCLIDMFPTVKYLKSNSPSLRAVNIRDSFFPEKSDFLLTDIFQISFHDVNIKNWPELDAISRANCDMSLGGWFLNGESIFCVLATSLFVRYDEGEQLKPLYDVCFPDDNTMTLGTSWQHEMRLRATELLSFLSQMEYLDHKIHPETTNFLRCVISRLIPSSCVVIRNPIKSGSDLLNPISSVVFRWCEDRIVENDADVDFERGMVSRMIQVDRLQAASILLNYSSLAAWYFGRDQWNWEASGSHNWPQGISDLVSTKLYRNLLEQESRPDVFRDAAAAIKRSFPHTPRRIQLFLTGQDRRETGPLMCLLRVREARKLLSEVLPSPNRTTRM